MEPSSPPSCLVVLRFDGGARLAGFSPEARAVFGLEPSALGSPLDRLVAEQLEPNITDLAAAVRRDREGRAALVADRRGRRWHAELRADESGGDDAGLVIALTPAEAEPTAALAPRVDFLEVMARAELPCAILDLHGAVRWANPALAALFGTEAGALVGADWFERAVPAERRSGLRPRFERALAEDGRPWRVEHPVTTADGERRPVAWHGLPFALAGSPALALIGRDVTAERRDRRALEAAGAQAEQASALKSRVLTAVGHDLQQPLQTLRFVHGVLARTVADPAARELVGVLADSVATMARAVDLLAQVSRRAPFDITPHPAPIALGDLLAGLRDRFADAAAAKGLRFTVVAGTARVRTDPAILAHLLDELVAAALRHTETGRVLVGCRRRGHGVVVEVVDTRATAPLAQLAALVDGASSPPALAGIARGPLDAGGLARRLEGLADHRLEVRTVLGRGAVFALHLPAARDLAVAPPPARGSAGEVLLVADDVAERDSLAQLLELEGYQVVAARDADAALRQVDGRPPPRVAIIDRPDAPGVEAPALARRLAARADAPVGVVALTAAPPRAPTGGDDGDIRYLEKPTDPQALLALIAELTAAAGAPGAAPAATTPDVARTVAVVAADATARERRLALLREAGHPTHGFAGTAEFLAADGPERAAAVLLDLGAAGRAGTAELMALTQGAGAVPVVVMHAGDDVTLAVAAMRAGAFDFLAEPVADDVLVATMRLALREGERRERRQEAEVETRHRFDRLTARERDVLRLVVAGHSNKEVAQHLGISPRTVENHRARIMEKSGAHSLAELVARARNAGMAE